MKALLLFPLVLLAAVLLAGCAEDEGPLAGSPVADPAFTTPELRPDSPAGEGTIHLDQYLPDPARRSHEVWRLKADIQYTCYYQHPERIVTVEAYLTGTLESMEGMEIIPLAQKSVNTFPALPKQWTELVTSCLIIGRPDGANLKICYKVNAIDEELYVDKVWLQLPIPTPVSVSTQ